MQIRCIFPIRRRWCSIIKVWFSHPSNSLRPLRYSHGHTGTSNHFHSTRNRLTPSYNGRRRNDFPRENREKEQTSITDLLHPNNPTPVWKALYPFLRPAAPDTPVIPLEFYSTVTSLSSIRNCYGQCFHLKHAVAKSSFNPRLNVK